MKTTQMDAIKQVNINTWNSCYWKWNKTENKKQTFNSLVAFLYINDLWWSGIADVTKWCRRLIDLIFKILYAWSSRYINGRTASLLFFYFWLFTLRIRWKGFQWKKHKIQLANFRLDTIQESWFFKRERKNRKKENKKIAISFIEIK